MLYSSLLLPHLNYSLLIWVITHQTHLHKLLILQKRAVRTILGLRQTESVSQKFSELGILKLDQLIKYKTLMMVYKIMNNTVSEPVERLLVPKIYPYNYPNTRLRDIFEVPRCRTQYRCNSFRFFAPKLCNHVNRNTEIRFNIPISQYKKQVKLFSQNEQNDL